MNYNYLKDIFIPIAEIKCNPKCDTQMNEDGTIYCYDHGRVLDEHENVIDEIVESE